MVASTTVSPAPITYVSFPAPPVNILAAELPINILFNEFPVPFIFPLPVKVKFSTFAPNVYVTED